MPLDSLEGEAEASVANPPKTASGDVKELTLRKERNGYTSPPMTR